MADYLLRFASNLTATNNRLTLIIITPDGKRLLSLIPLLKLEFHGTKVARDAEVNTPISGDLGSKVQKTSDYCN